MANGNYLLQNVGAGNYAYVEDDAAVNTKVVGSSSKREWVINGTGTTDIYTYASPYRLDTQLTAAPLASLLASPGATTGVSTMMAVAPLCVSRFSLCPSSAC